MPFWSKYTDPPTSMICGFKKEHMLNDINVKFGKLVLGILVFLRNQLTNDSVLRLFNWQ